MKKIHGIMAFAMSVALSACASLSSVIKAPELSLHSVNVTGIDFNGIDVLCKVNVKNVNRVTVPFPRVAWDLFIADGKLVDGVIETGEDLKAGKTIIVDVAFHLEYLNVYQTVVALKDAAKSGEKQTTYKVDVAMTFDLPVLGKTTVQIPIDGNLPLLQMPKFSDVKIAMGSIDFTGISFACTVNVENPNDFDIPLPKLGGDYKVNNSFSLPISAAVGGGLLAANAVSPITFTIGLKYAELYAAVQGLASMGEAPGAVSVTPSSGIPAFADDEPETLQETNKIPLLKMPTIAFKGVTVKPINPLAIITNPKIDFDLGFEIENKNAFPLTLNTLAYNFKVDGKSWVNTSAPGGTTIGAGQKVSIPLSASVSAGNLVSEIAGMVTAKKANVPYSCEGRVTLGGTPSGLKPVTITLPIPNPSGTMKF